MGRKGRSAVGRGAGGVGDRGGTGGAAGGRKGGVSVCGCVGTVCGGGAQTRVSHGKSIGKGGDQAVRNPLAQTARGGLGCPSRV